MSLYDLEHALARVCLSPEPAADDLERLGAGRTWALYREMVRERLLDMPRAGLPRTVATLGNDVYRRWATRWLVEAPPRTPFIRDLVASFLDFAQTKWSEDPALPPHLADLATFERALWEVGNLRTEAVDVVPFEFERPVALAPAHRLLDLGWSVHDEAEPPTPGTFHVMVYRRPDANTVGSFVLNDLAAAIVSEWRRGEGTAAQGVRRVAEARDRARDQAFFEGLASIVADFIERGLIVGSRR